MNLNAPVNIVHPGRLANGHYDAANPVLKGNPMTTEVQRFDRHFGLGREDCVNLDPRKVKIQPGWNVRDMDSPGTREHVDLLKASIRERGLDEPITVRFDQATGVATLVDGQCRLTACRELWNEGVKVKYTDGSEGPPLCFALRAKGDEAELTARALVANTGRPLEQWEIGVGCKRLQKLGWGPEQIASHICKPIRYINEAIALAEVSVEAKQMMAAGEVSAPRVLQEVKKHGDKAVEVLKEAVKKAPKPAKGKKPKPLARTKAESPSDKALAMADELANMIVDEKQSWDDVMALARKFIKLRAK